MNNKVFLAMYGSGYEACYIDVKLFSSKKSANCAMRKLAEQAYKDELSETDLSDHDIDKIVKKISISKLREKLSPDFWYEIKTCAIQP